MKARIVNCLKFLQLFSLVAIVLSVPLTASAAVCSSAGQSSFYEWVDSVQFGSFSHVSGNDAGYADFTATQTIPLSPGLQNISLTPGFNTDSYTQYWSVWIDFNQNQLFESTEQIFTGTSSSAVSGSINVPASALPGLTAMRVSMKYGSAPSACETFTSGEVEDYTVDIAGEPAPEPVSLTTLYTINVDNNYIISRTGDLGDPAAWVIEKDGIIVLERNAANELDYTYFNNTNGSYFRVWLNQFIDGKYEIVSNVVSYVPGTIVLPPPNPVVPTLYTLNVDNNYIVSRTGDLGDPAVWVIEKDGVIVLERNAANELEYTYFNNTNGSYYRVWLKQFINGAYEIVSNVVNYEPGVIILPPPDPVAPTQFTLNVDNNYVLSRTGELGDNVTWEIEKDGVIVLSRNASFEMNYQYFNNTIGSNFKVWLASGGQPISNAVEYVGGSPVSSHDINIDASYKVSRSGLLGEPLTWVIEKDGVIVLERNAENELDYTYYINTNGSYYRVWLKQFINGKYEIVSNVIYYVPGIAILPYNIITNSAYDLIRDGAIGDQVSWVVEENGVVIFEQDASTGLVYNYPGLLAQNTYRAWLVQMVNGVPEAASNVLEFTPGINFATYSLSVDPTNRVYRSGSLGDSLTWVIEKNGTVVLQRNAANELDYLYFSNTSGSSFRVWLEQFSGTGYYRVSDIVEYSIP